MNQKNTEPLPGPATRYRIKMRGRLSLGWLQSFRRTAEITFEAAVQTEDIAIL